ncbi:MAG: CapA family protein [Lachnospiraceae bacterium]|nr:CapA family protein [Lachnospiraceae bacterium]
MTESLIKKDIKAAKEVADFVIICPHWGTEYVHYATKNQKNWAKFFMECGADLCIGTHPHVIEPVEWIENDEGDKMLVYYSLGNFVNSTASNKIGVANRMLGAMATVTIAKNRKDGTVYIKEYGAEPLVTFVPNSGKGIATMHLEDFTDELALKSMTYQKDPNFSVDFLQQLWQEVMGNLPN